MLGEFAFVFSLSLDEAIVSNNVDITKIYIERDRMQIDELRHKIIDYSVKLIGLKSWIISIISPCSDFHCAI